jgi:cytosine/adenosine deaminase-related metal-dependent hydrolase
MPAPPIQPTNFLEILQQVWWRLDSALDLDMIYWSAKLGAIEALMNGTTGIIDHHESPNAIEGSLDVIAQACAEVGVRVNCSYGVTDRHGVEAGLRGLEENRRFIAAGGRGMVGVHCMHAPRQASGTTCAPFGRRILLCASEQGPERNDSRRLP